jgi:hypothetical protein
VGSSPLFHLKPFICLEFVAFGSRQISLVEHSRSSFYFLWFLFCLCAGEDLPLSSGDADEDY